MKVFVVEDDVFYAKVMQQKLSADPKIEVEIYTSGADIIANMHKRPSVITLDYSLPDMEGGTVLEEIRRVDPDVPVVVVSGQEDINTAVNLLKLGVYDYIVKGDGALNRLVQVMSNVSKHLSMTEELAELRHMIKSRYTFDSIIGNSASIHRMFKFVEKAASTNIAVSLTGEPGTGAGLVAKTIHYNSARNSGPFVTLDVTSLPAEILEKELFGCEKNAIPGVFTQKIGKLEEAKGGTLYIKGIASVSSYMQSLLLDALRVKQITRLGGSERVDVDSRVICSFPPEIKDIIKTGAFREDLYYSLLGLPIDIPPLRDRGSDIVVLAKHFLDEFTTVNSLGSMTMSSKAQEKLLNYPYPGNIRELKAVIELASVMSVDNVIEAENITFNSSRTLSDFLFEEKTLKDYTRGIIKHFLEKYDGNVLLVAKKLDVGKSTIYRMLKNNEL